MSPSRRFLGLILVSIAFGGTIGVGGCSRQKEGERCSLLNGDADCDSEQLFCTAASKLRGGEDEVDRCCLHPEEEPNDSRCDLRTTANPGDGDGGGGEGGIGGSDSGDDGNGIGTGCLYNSDCAADLICGPSGLCIPECNTSRDCPDGQDCDKNRICVDKD